MCLDTVIDKEHRPDDSGEGWKIFLLGRSGSNRGKLVSWLKVEHKHYEINQWYEAYDFDDDDKVEYWRGFHVFKTYRDAKRYSFDHFLRKVRWRHHLATGLQIGGGYRLPCIVAKEILILPR